MIIKLRDRLLWGLSVGGEILESILTGGSRAYHHDKLYLWTPLKYSKRKFRQLVGRMLREGLMQRVLIEGQVHYRATGAGKRVITQTFPALKTASDNWDGFWRIVMFDISEKKRRHRDMLRRELIKMGFGKLQNSTYISPYDRGKELTELLQLRGLSGSTLILEAKQKHLGNPKDLAEKVWGLEQIKKDYTQLIDRLSTRFGIADRLKREEFLKKCYQDFLKVAVRDPFLPQELLPVDWPAAKARSFVVRSAVVK